jgi:hypothetical protein
MSYINKQGDAVINTKLTTIGRQLLAHGSLTFSSFAIGDSEINYNTISNNGLAGEMANILRPVDNQPPLRYPITRLINEGTFKYPVSSPYPTDNIIVNPARERGFFSRTAPGQPYQLTATGTYMKTASKVVSAINGTNSITLDGLSNSVTIGDFALIQWFPPNNPNATAQGVVAGDLKKAVPSVFTWYKIKDASSADRRLTLDRNIPNFSDGGAATVYVYPGGDSIRTYFGPDAPGDYWDPNLIAFNATQSATYVDVPVWNLSIVYDDTVLGALDTMLHSGYPTKTYEGIRTYFNVNRVAQPVGLLHYSNYTVENFYGEGFNKNTFVLELPHLMYHGSLTPVLGATFTCGNTKQILSDSGSGFSTPYYDLIDAQNTVVGKVFIDLKVCLIENSEILAALSYTSNRNWTLPPLKSVSVVQKSTNASFTGPYYDLYLTYRFANPVTDGAPQYFDSNAFHLGYGESSHSQNLSVITGLDATTFSGVDFKLNYDDLKFIASSSNWNTNPGAGYSVGRLVMLVQIVPTGQLPHYDRWTEIDYTAKLQNYVAGKSITRESLSAQIYRLEGDAIRLATNRTLDGTNPYYQNPYLVRDGGLTYGEEVFLLGNVKVDIQAIYYKTRFSILLGNGEFASSRNPTWALGTPVYISEVGIYDSLDNLVAVGKLSHPLRKDAYSLRFITVDLDF